MNTTVLIGCAAVMGGALLALATDPANAGGIGPDVIIGDLTGPKNWSAPPFGNGPINGIVRYSLGTTSCNVGTEPLDWYDFDTPDPKTHPATQHPVIAQNLYRLKDGRFEHVGQSWLKHGFCALQQNVCGTCQPFCGECCHELGVGCSDPYSPNLNGNPTRLGPKAHINPATGKINVWPFPLPENQDPNGNFNGQIHVKVEDLDPALNPGALYFTEGLYIAEDDAVAGNDTNNAGWRQVSVGDSAGYPLTFVGETQREQAAIEAWQAMDPDVTITYIDIPDDGRMILGFKVSDNSDGTWHYEYAVYNLNSDRAGQSFTVPVPDCVNVTNIGFHDVDYHSGDGAVIGINYDGTDWAATRAAGMLTWSTEAMESNDNANALRWSTLYNFRFDADQPPQDVDITIGLYKPGDFPAVSVGAVGPQGSNAPSCPADVAPAGGDGQVNVSDLLLVINHWSTSGPGDAAPPCGDGIVNVSDLLAIINAWGACP